MSQHSFTKRSNTHFKSIRLFVTISAYRSATSADESGNQILRTRKKLHSPKKKEEASPNESEDDQEVQYYYTSPYQNGEEEKKEHRDEKGRNEEVESDKEQHQKPDNGWPAGADPGSKERVGSEFEEYDEEGPNESNDQTLDESLKNPREQAGLQNSGNGLLLSFMFEFGEGDLSPFLLITSITSNLYYFCPFRIFCLPHVLPFFIFV